VELTTAAFSNFQRDRREEGKAPATINRELELLRAALRYAAKQTPPKVPAHLVPTIPMLPVENTRTGFFTVAEVKALLEHLNEPDVRDFVEWAFRTGMRRREIAKLEWSMLDQSGKPWVLRISGTITKNAKGRSFGFDGEALATMTRRLQGRRPDCPLIFHRAGRMMGPFHDRWRSALKAAGLPPGRLFHDLRRSAVRNLIRSGVDQTTAMKVSGHPRIPCSAATTSSRNPRPPPLLRIQQGSEDGWCRRWESNPHEACASRDFESRASASFATPARAAH